MIVSHRHRFIFLKTVKTAGTSIEIGLSQFCGADDVITTITPEDEALRRELGYRGPQNFRAPFSTYGSADWRRFLARRSRLGFFNHMPAAQVRRLVGPDVWTSYFKFTVERNPWDKVVSAYFWRNRDRPRPWPSLAEWLGTGPAAYVNGYDIYSIYGKVAVDRVLRYEDLDAELLDIGDLLGLPEAISIPRAKGGYRVDRRPYQELFDDAARRHVDVAYAREIALMGYVF